MAGFICNSSHTVFFHGWIWTHFCCAQNLLGQENIPKKHLLFILASLKGIEFLLRPSRKTSSVLFRGEYCRPGTWLSILVNGNRFWKEIEKLVQAKRARSHFFRLLPVPNKTNKATFIAKTRIECAAHRNWCHFLRILMAQFRRFLHRWWTSRWLKLTPSLSMNWLRRC